MVIYWAGMACFKIEGQNATIVVDPFDQKAGLKLGRPKADIVLSSSDGPLHGNVSAVSGKEKEPFVIGGAGEYEVSDVMIYGKEIPGTGTSGGSVVYRIQIDGMTLAFLGSVSRPLENGQLEHFEKTDILFIPVGGNGYLNAEQAAAAVNQIEPRIVIPMMYKVPGAKKSLDALSAFLKEFGAPGEETVQKIRISKKDLPSDETKIVCMKPS